MIEIIAYDHVVVAGVRIPRPITMSVTDWEGFWRAAMDADKVVHLYEEGYADGYEAGCLDTRLEHKCSGYN